MSDPDLNFYVRYSHSSTGSEADPAGEEPDPQLQLERKSREMINVGVSLVPVISNNLYPSRCIHKWRVGGTVTTSQNTSVVQLQYIMSLFPAHQGRIQKSNGGHQNFGARSTLKNVQQKSGGQ